MFRMKLYNLLILMVIFSNSFNGFSQNSNRVLCFTHMENLFIRYYVLNELAKKNKKLKLTFNGAPLYIILYELKFRKFSIKPVLDIKLGKKPFFVVGLHFFNKETKEELICYFPDCCNITVKDFEKRSVCLRVLTIAGAEYWNPRENIYELIGNAGRAMQILMLPKVSDGNYVVIKSRFCNGKKKIPMKEYRKLLEKYRKKIKFREDRNCSDRLYDYVEDMNFMESMNYDFRGLF